MKNVSFVESDLSGLMTKDSNLWNARGSVYTDTKETKTITKLLEYLKEKNVLKIGSIEGMDAYFQDLENILKRYQEEKTSEWAEWLHYWTNCIHRNHITSFPNNKNFEDCLDEYCIAAQQTLHELGNKAMVS